nr:alpha/beta fold hydrolase [Dyella acidiphila]
MHKAGRNSPDAHVDLRVTLPTEQRITLSHHLTLTAQSWGASDAPPLLTLHGWLDNAGSYAFLAPLLAERWRVIALELPGHGHSSHLPAGINYHYVDYVSAVLAAADALQLERYTLLGHSLGAGIASWWRRRNRKASSSCI